MSDADPSDSRERPSDRPDRPRLVYDDDCGFCTWSVEWAVRHGDFEPVGFAELTADQRDRLPENWESCAHLFADGTVYSCGKAAEAVLARSETVPPEVFDFLGAFSDYERLREDAYRFIADRRDWLGMVVRAEPPVRRSEES